MSPVGAAALLKEGDDAYARCKRLLPPSWVAALKRERKVCLMMKPVLDEHMQHSPNAWQGALGGEEQFQQLRRAVRAQAKAGEGLPRCDGCGLPAAQLKWCACRLKRYCGKDCQKRDFPAHKAECKAARGIA